MEKVLKDKDIANIKFDFFNKAKSLNSLLYLFSILGFFRTSKITAYQIDNPENM